MRTQLWGALMAELPGLRHEPSAKRVRAMWNERTVVDSVRAVLVWEPRRVVPSWAVPIEDVSAELVRSVRVDGQGREGVGSSLPDVSRRPVLDPSIPFAVHTTAGVVVKVVDGRGSLAAGLLPANADLVG